MLDDGDEKITEGAKPAEPAKAEETPAPSIDSTNERTKQEFEKLKETNKELKKERDSYKNVLDSLKPDKPITPPAPNIPPASNYSHLDQNKVNEIAKSLVDDNGMVDMNKLTSMLVEANTRAANAEHEAKSARQESKKTLEDFEETELMRKVHNKFPEIDPKNDKFNEELYDSVRNELVGQMLRGEKEDIWKATEKWHVRMFGKAVPKEAVKKEKEANEARKAISQTPSGAATNRYSTADHDDLVRRTRLGDKNALKERLERSGY